MEEKHTNLFLVLLVVGVALVGLAEIGMFDTITGNAPRSLQVKCAAEEKALRDCSMQFGGKRADQECSNAFVARDMCYKGELPRSNCGEGQVYIEARCPNGQPLSVRTCTRGQWVTAQQQC